MALAKLMHHILLWIIIIVSVFLCEALEQNEMMSRSLVDIPSDQITPDNIVSNGSCYPPLIWYTGKIEDDMMCVGTCCLSCPYMDNFYPPENSVKQAFEIFAGFGIVSFFAVLLLALIFLVLPSQKRNPTVKQLLLPLALSVCYFEGSEFFTIQQDNSQCINEVRRANIRDNYMCAIQSFFTLGGAYAIAFWSSLLMIHLHLISLWKSDFITRHIKIFAVSITAISLLAVILPMSLNKVEATNICFISLEDAPLYFRLLSFIYVALFLHLITFGYMVKVSFKANWKETTDSSTTRMSLSLFEAQQTLSHVTNIIRVQWRASLGALLMFSVYSVNWIFYTFKMPVIKSESDTDWLHQWFLCLANGTQSSCAVHADGHVPSYGLIIAILFYNRFCGIIIFFLFAGKKAIFIELWSYMKGQSTTTPRHSIRHSIRHSTSSMKEKRSAFIEKRDSIKKERKLSFSSIISTSSNNTPMSTSLGSSLSAPYPTSILMSPQESYPFKVTKSSNAKRLTFSSFTSDNNYVIEPVKVRNSTTYVTLRYSDLLKSYEQDSGIDEKEESLADVTLDPDKRRNWMEKYNNVDYKETKLTMPPQNNNVSNYVDYKETKLTMPPQNNDVSNNEGNIKENTKEYIKENIKETNEGKNVGKNEEKNEEKNEINEEINEDNASTVQSDQSNYNQSNYNQSSYSQSNYNQSNYNQSNYNQSNYNQFNRFNYNPFNYNQSNYNRSSYNQSNYNQSNYNQSSNNQSGYNHPRYNHSSYINSNYNQYDCNQYD